MFGAAAGAPAGTPRVEWNGRAWVSQRRWRMATTPLMRIERWDPRHDGLLTESAIRVKMESRGYEASARQYAPDARACAEAENSERLEAVVTGLLKVTLDGEAAILAAGDILFVPRGSVRSLEVVGSSPVRCLEAVYRDTPQGGD